MCFKVSAAPTGNCWKRCPSSGCPGPSGHSTSGFPSSSPTFSSACTVSLGISWKAGIAAEIIGIPAGSIGRMFYDAKVYFNTVDLFAWTVIVVVISVLFEKGFLALLKGVFGRLETL